MGGWAPNYRHCNNPSLGPVRRVATRFAISQTPQAHACEPRSYLPCYLYTSHKIIDEALSEKNSAQLKGHLLRWHV